MEVEVRVEGMDELLNAINQIAEKVPEGVPDLLSTVASEGKDLMDSLTPVRSGYLKSRNAVEVDDTTITLSNDAEYAPYVNYGTRYMAAQPFFDPAVEYMTQELTTLAEALLEDL